MRIQQFGSVCTGLFLGAISMAACESEDSGPTGSIEISVVPEDVILQGLAPGVGPENLQDGWGVTFEKYVVTIGGVTLTDALDPTRTFEDPRSYVLDLVGVPLTGELRWSFPEIPEGRWNLSYATPNATTSVLPQDGLNQIIYQKMIGNQWTYWVEGVMRNLAGQSCPPSNFANPGTKETNGQSSGSDPCYAASEIRFEIGAPAPTLFGPCEIDGIPGVASTVGVATQASVAIHGDHLFFNGFPEGDEGSIQRMSQWLADCDLDLNGVVTVEELSMIPIPALPALANAQLGGSPIAPLQTVYQYVQAQFKTQGHFQGEGECAIDSLPGAQGTR